MACLIGKWQSNPNTITGYDDFLDAIGTSKEEKEMVRGIVFYIEISQKDEDTWRQVLSVPGFPNPQELEFKSGKEFNFIGLDGKKKYKCTVNIGENKFSEKVAVQKEDGSWLEWDAMKTREGDILQIVQTYQGKTEIIRMTKM